MNNDPYLPISAKIVERRQESATVFTLRLELPSQVDYSFKPGQFNMLYLYGVGEVAISIVSDPDERTFIEHTIRQVGRVTNGLAKLKVGDELGLRGPFGRGWPLANAENKDVVIITGGLGCAPVVSVINFIEKRRSQFKKLVILQGIKHSDDFIFRKRYALWEKLPNTTVFIAADKAGQQWPFSTGHVTDFIQQINTEPKKTVVMMCGPEGMLHVAVNTLLQKEIDEKNIYLSMERNMACAVGHCGHCQYGSQFVCKNGPVFTYADIKPLFGVPGF